MNLKLVLMELGNRLVIQHGFFPASQLPGGMPCNGQTTWAIAHFTEWLNDCQQAQDELALMGVDWPVTRRGA